MARTSPNISGSVTHVKTEIIIDAPIAVVWNTIIDFPSYSQWNSFVRYQIITDASYKPLPEQPPPSEGAYLLMKCRIPPTTLDGDDKGLTHSKERIAYVDNLNHSISWKQTGYPDWLLKTERWQALEEVDLDGKKATKYATVLTLNGPFAFIIKWFMMGNMTVSFEVMAKNLKARSEYLAKASF